ncbi:Carbamoyl-phosphate synthase large chain [Frankliniella fusca]|uniref:Carbamoyl-phosphate synthase large chain n=1 Tax=Frankliniella fusca TaxID=407009 RepID=A0AAE1HXQ3_9NEOP|nr:Carbamoyl-phosphate synthase large chain [Frankliniella fusca]
MTSIMAHVYCDVQMLRNAEGQFNVKEFSVYHAQWDVCQTATFLLPYEESRIPERYQRQNRFVTRHPQPGGGGTRNLEAGRNLAATWGYPYYLQRKQNAKQKMRYVVERHEGYLHIDTAFLFTDPSTWHLEKSFIVGLETAKALQAERGVALVKSYTACGNVSNNESKFQKLLEVCRILMMEETSRDLTVNGVIERIKYEI